MPKNKNKPETSEDVAKIIVESDKVVKSIKRTKTFDKFLEDIEKDYSDVVSILRPIGPGYGYKEMKEDLNIKYAGMVYNAKKILASAKALAGHIDEVYNEVKDKKDNSDEIKQFINDYEKDHKTKKGAK